MKKFKHLNQLIIIAVLFILAVVFGLAQRQTDPYVYNADEVQEEFSEYYNKGLETAEKDSLLRSVTFLAVGDIMLSRNVAGTYTKANNPLLPYKNMESVLKSTDFNFANLESPFSGRDDFNPTGSMVFNAPRNSVQGLKDYNFKIITLANNHALDQGVSGIDYTLKYLSDNNIKHVGLGKNLDEAWAPEILEMKGMRIGFVGASYSSINDNGRARNEYVARMEDTERLKSAINFLKGQSDFIVVSMHAGTEYVTNPNQLQVNFARTAIDAGADMIIGHHPHWVQTIEKYNGKYIFYSLGNFIFDQEWSQETKEGLTLKITLTQPTTSPLQGPKVRANIKEIELIPVIIENYSTPRVANDIEAKRILDRIGIKDKILK